MRTFPMLLLVAGLCIAPGRPTLAAVVVNGATLDAAQISTLATHLGIAARDGHYWYDPISGAFGLEGQGTAGFLPAGLGLGGLLRADASGGGDGRYGGVFVNGRELHPVDIAGLQRLLGSVIPGRYWVDAQGTFGVEGQGALGNLRWLAQQRGGSSGPRSSRPSGCYGGGCDTTHTWVGDNYFSDGKTGCIVMDGEISC
jgi:hypothetical protein